MEREKQTNTLIMTQLILFLIPDIFLKKNYCKMTFKEYQKPIMVGSESNNCFLYGLLIVKCREKLSVIIYIYVRLYILIYMYKMFILYKFELFVIFISPGIWHLGDCALIDKVITIRRCSLRYINVDHKRAT